jgi:signal transduction histidine kinase
VFDNPEQTERARNFHYAVWLIMLVTTVVVLGIVATQIELAAWALRSLATVDGLGLAGLMLNRQGKTRLASLLLVGGVIALVTFNSLSAGGIRSPGVTLYFVFVLMAGLLLGQAAAIVTALACAMLGLGLIVAEGNGFLPEPTVRYNAVSLWLLNCLYMGVVVILLRLATQTISKALRRAETELTERKAAEKERERFVADLAKRVKELRLVHSAAKLLGDRPFDQQVLSELVSQMPGAWMHPDCCEAHIAYGDLEASTPNWKSSAWMLSEPLTTSGGKGVIEVAYREPRASMSENPFIGEERELLRSLAEMLTAYLERNEAERRRAVLEAQLLQSQKMEALGTLAGGVAHDFNNLLGAIQGFAQLMTADLRPGFPPHSFAQRILAACDRGRDLVEQILAFAHGGTQERTVVNLSQLLQECEPLVSATLPKSADLNVIHPVEDLRALAHRGQISRLIVNLCRNAGDSLGNKPGNITVELSRASRTELANWSEGASEENRLAVGTLNPMAEYARLRVSDNGAGISADILKRIFDPFFTTKGRGRGTGLGLAVVHGVVESHGGACSVETTPGLGTAFSVYLPLTSAPAADTRPAIHTDSLRGSERILVVDDEPDIVDMLVIGLDRLGYEVVGENDPMEALNAFVEDPSAWDAVITDQVMPGMLGTELLSKLKTVRSRPQDGSLHRICR